MRLAGRLRTPSIGWTAASIPDQTGRIALVTGANSGLGLATVIALAKAGASVVMAVRNADRGATARSRVLSAAPGADVRVGVVDLADLASVRRFAAAESATLERLDIVVNNAGIMAIPPALSPDGVELQFAANHLGHFALTVLLEPLLSATPGSRVVAVSSLAATSGSLVDLDPTSLDGYERFAVYGTTKLANQAFTAELDRRLARANARAGRPIAVAAHPGLASTNLQSGFALGGWKQSIVDVGAKFVTQPASVGALSQLRAATDPDVAGADYFGPSLPGQYYGPPRRLALLPSATDPAIGRRLWDLSVELSGVDDSRLPAA